MNENEERTKFIRLFNWLDKKLKSNSIKKTKLERYVTANYFEIWHHKNIDFAEKVLKVYLCSQQKNKIAVIQQSLCISVCQI